MIKHNFFLRFLSPDLKLVLHVIDYVMIKIIHLVLACFNLNFFWIIKIIFTLFIYAYLDKLNRVHSNKQMEKKCNFLVESLTKTCR